MVLGQVKSLRGERGVMRARDVLARAARVIVGSCILKCKLCVVVATVRGKVMQRGWGRHSSFHPDDAFFIL